MKKLIFAATMIVAFSSNLFAGGPWNCSVDGYVGPDGTSCLYTLDGCYYKVTHHRLFFGLFKWNTEEKVGCTGSQSNSLSTDTSVESGG